MPLDPAPYAAFGVMGGLLFAVVVLTLLLWRLFNKQSEHFAVRDKVLMDFVDGHRKEFTASLDNIATKVNDSQTQSSRVLSATMEDVKNVIAQHTRRLDNFMLTATVLNKVDQMKKKGDILDETTIERVVRSVLSEQKDRS